MTEENEFFNPADFESISLEVYFKNMSTGRAILGGNKVSILEVSDKSITLSVPERECAPDNHVMIEIYRGEELLFSSTARAREVQESEGPMMVLLELIQFEKKSWDEFLRVFSKRQEEISQFFEMGKK